MQHFSHFEVTAILALVRYLAAWARSRLRRDQPALPEPPVSRRLRLDRTARVRQLGRRSVLRMERGSRLTVTHGGQMWHLTLYANGSLMTTRAPRGWSVELGQRAVARESGTGADAELWFTLNVPTRATLTIETLAGRTGSGRSRTW